jgi:CheY-like chemotaxis protein
MPRTALVVEDDAVSQLVLGHMLRTQGWTVEEAADTPDAIARCANGNFELVVSDFHLPSGTGLDILDSIHGSGKSPAFILITGIIEHASLPPELTAGPDAHLTKPVSSATLRDALDRLFPPSGS